jgi:hypothetical protein
MVRLLPLAEDTTVSKQLAERQARPVLGVLEKALFIEPSSRLDGRDLFHTIHFQLRLKEPIDGVDIGPPDAPDPVRLSGWALRWWLSPSHHWTLHRVPRFDS